MEHPIKFVNNNGKELFGILHTPDNNGIKSEKVGVNLLNPGIKYRVAPHRLNVKISRMLCKSGLSVFRFDPEGIGDSEGELYAGQNIYEVWGDIQRGRFVNDVLKSNQQFKLKCGINKIILIGNCGGAVTAALAASIDDSVDGLILIDLPVMKIGLDYSYADRIINNKKVINYLLLEYVKSMFNLNSWINFMRGKTEIRALKKVIKLKMSLLLNVNVEHSDDMIDNQKVNKDLLKTFDILINKKKKILFINASNDIGTESFNVYFKEKYLCKIKYNMVDIHTVEGANHIYTMYEWQEDLMNKISWWISEQYTK